jgi:polysaccharide biosynthesis protein PslG
VLRRGTILLTTLLLLLLTSASTLPHARAVERPDAPTLDLRPFGLNSHIASRYPDPSTLDIPARVVARSRAGWVREDFQWFRIEPRPGEYHWHFHDRAVELFGRYDIKILGVLGPSVGWATPSGQDRADDVSFSPPDPQAFARYAYATALRYKDTVQHWEIWNEPDNPLFWQPAPDPAAYSELLRQAAAAVKRANPNAKVLVGGLNPFDLSFMHALHGNGVWDSFDILNLHPYVDPLAPEDGNIIASTDSVRALARDYGEKPIWVTELGWSSGRGDRDKVGVTNEDQQADYLIRAMALLWTAGVERVFWYALKDDVNNPYGLVALGEGRSDFTRLKPAFFAFRTLNRTLGGAKLVGMRDLFGREVVHEFESVDSWLREGPAPGAISYDQQVVNAGAQSLRIEYSFATRGNDYVVFTPGYRPLLPESTRLLGMWVRGDGSAHTLKVWLQDAAGAVVQYPIGAIGGNGWHFISAPIGREVPEWDRISGGSGQIVFPLRFFALVVDDAPDAIPSSGSFHVDSLTALTGAQAYDLRLQRGDESIDVLWAPSPSAGSIRTLSISAEVLRRDGSSRSVDAEDGVLRFNLGPSPIFVRHRRP